MSIRTLRSYSLWLCFLLVSLAAQAAPEAVGHVVFVKGSNIAQLAGTARAIGKDDEIFQGDSIQTNDGFIIIEFNDGAKITVRPNSNFDINRYNNEFGQQSAQLALTKGEISTATGGIAQNNPQNFQITTPTATVKPQSNKAEFSVNVCEKDCDKAKGTGDLKVKLEQNLVARVVEIKGEVSAINRADKAPKERILSLGKPLYNSDYIHSKKDSWALLVFPDGEKITLQPNSEMDIKQYSYQAQGKKDQVVLRLAMGGLRALSGSIAQKNHEAFALETPVATIGIRGTETFTQLSEEPPPSSAININHRTLQGTSVVSYMDNSGKTNENVIPAGSTLEMTATPAPTTGAPTTGGAPAVEIEKSPEVKPTPPNAVQPQGPPLIPDPEATKALFESEAAPSSTIVKMVTGTGTISDKNDQNSAYVSPGDTGTIKSNSDLTIMSSTTGTETQQANSEVNQSVNQSVNTDTNKTTSTPSATNAINSVSELQVSNPRQLPNPASPN